MKRSGIATMLRLLLGSFSVRGASIFGFFEYFLCLRRVFFTRRSFPVGGEHQREAGNESVRSTGLLTYQLLFMRELDFPHAGAPLSSGILPRSGMLMTIPELT